MSADYLLGITDVISEDERRERIEEKAKEIIELTK